MTAKMLGARLHDFIVIPKEGRQPLNRESFHYENYFRPLVDYLRTQSSGRLVLIGAGLFSKRYCDAVKTGGGIGIDLGSGFDILANRPCRPIHDCFNIERLRWL